jgi:pheromone shutdown protein TraB
VSSRDALNDFVEGFMASAARGHKDLRRARTGVERDQLFLIVNRLRRHIGQMRGVGPGQDLDSAIMHAHAIQAGVGDVALPGAIQAK